MSRNSTSAVPFAEVVNAHWNSVYKMLHTMTRDTHDTDDLTQETFLRALKRFDSFQEGTNLRAWLLRIATNAFFDLRRKRQRVKIGPMEQEPPATLETPGHRLDVKEQSERLQAAMAELSETARLVFHLRATEDLSFREIAEMVGTTEQAARWHMHQARSILLKKMEA